LAAIDRALRAARDDTGRPSLILLRTHIGYGSPHRQDRFESHGSPLGVEGTDDREVGDRAQAGELLHWLMDGPVLAQGDAVVGEDVDHMQAHQRGHAHGRAHVVRENEKRRAEWQDAAMRRQTVQNRAHGMLTHAPVEAGASQGWHRYVGDRGDVLGVDRFGASAPGETVMREYGFTVENICKRVLTLLR